MGINLTGVHEVVVLTFKTGIEYIWIFDESQVKILFFLVPINF